ASSKLSRALHGLPDASEIEPGTAARAIADYVYTQCDALTAGHFAISLKPFEPEATVEPHEAVHQTRVATRRLRALLRTFAPLFERARCSGRAQTGQAHEARGREARH